MTPAMSAASPVPLPEGPVLVTGGAGFVGSNLVDRLAAAGIDVIVYDNFSRDGARDNMAWLTARHGSRIDVRMADVRDAPTLAAAVRDARTIFHLAAQVAVTTSIVKPNEDFAVNCAATVALLEAARRCTRRPRIVYSSTNKVYGDLDGIRLHTVGSRCEPDDPDLNHRGVSERMPLSFVSPYGCSKGAADQYVLDYGRTYDIPACVLRMSCIFGPRQRGTEDQGWVAHFAIRALEGSPITVFGDGRQIRDLLEVSDLVDVLLLAGQPGSPLTGQPMNVGGGRRNATSLLELLNLMGGVIGRLPEIRFGPPRPGDQRWYVSDTSRLEAATGWRPKLGIRDGLVAMIADLRDRGLAGTRTAPSLRATA